MDDGHKVARHLWDYAENHERLQAAASELSVYLRELLSTAGIDVFAVDARAKSLTSYRHKSEKLREDGSLKYDDPARQIEDCVAARIIVFTKQARSRTVTLLEQAGTIPHPGPMNPGDDKHNGYDSDHLIITAFADEDLQRRAGELHWFLGSRPGLEVQVRTVAGHAWAEYEHDIRYKTPTEEEQDATTSGYDALQPPQKEHIDQLFVEAGGLRKYLDMTFDLIEQVLRPESDNTGAKPTDSIVEEDDDDLVAEDMSSAPLDDGSLREYLALRYPGHDLDSERTRGVLLQYTELLGVATIQSLEAALQDVDTKHVTSLMPYGGPPTAVRRLEDDLLARFQEELIGVARLVNADRAPLLEGRLRRIRGKLLIYSLISPESHDDRFMTAARTFRELVRLVVDYHDLEAAALPGLVSTYNDLDGGARAKQIKTSKGPMWVNSNLTRAAAEEAMLALLEKLPYTGIKLIRAGDELGRARA